MSRATPPRGRRRPFRPDGVKVVIVYEDKATGLRGRHFADDLIQELRRDRRCEDCLWRGEMLAFPTLAAEASDDSADAEYLIVSLHGDVPVPRDLRFWLEQAMGRTRHADLALIVVFDSLSGDRPVLDGAREFFRGVSAIYDVPFFSHASSAPRSESLPRRPLLTAAPPGGRLKRKAKRIVNRPPR